MAISIRVRVLFRLIHLFNIKANNFELLSLKFLILNIKANFFRLKNAASLKDLTN